MESRRYPALRWVMTCQVVYNHNYKHNRSRTSLTQLELSARQGRYHPHPGLRVRRRNQTTDCRHRFHTQLAPADGPLLVLLS
jgi:hypothetical protein